MLQPLPTALAIVLPVALAGLTQVAVIRLGLLRALAAAPLDFGASLGSRRLFGDNKTLRGLVVMVLASAAWFLAQHRLLLGLGWDEAALPAFQRLHPLLWGALAGLGYVAGELPNSFVKRRLGISAGGAARGAPGALFWVIDQVDSVAGVLVVLLPFWTPSLAVVAALLGLTLLVHPLVALAMFCLGLKDRIG